MNHFVMIVAPSRFGGKSFNYQARQNCCDKVVKMKSGNVAQFEIQAEPSGHEMWDTLMSIFELGQGCVTDELLRNLKFRRE